MTRMRWLFPFFTCGGLFYWVDRHSYAGWRIQESIWTRRCRLLDPYNIKRAAGSFELCYDTMLYFLRAWEVMPPPKKAVVMIHGLFQRPSSFEKMSRGFQKNFEPIVFSYPMLRFDLVKSARALNALLDRRQDISQINFVVYGMGGLILRQAIELNPSWLERIGRSVFLAVPNHGYSWADKWKEKWWYKWALGAAGKCILPETAEALFPMKGDFGVIMGGKDDAKGFMPLFKQDNDGILTVAAAKQNGAREEYLALNKTHFFLHQDDKILELALSFLNTGRFGRGMRIRKEQSYTNLWDR